MDPRPYHFEFRKPRPSNPTFQSANLYDTMYQVSNMKVDRVGLRNPQANRYKEAQNKKPLSEPDTMKRNQSMQIPRNDKANMFRYQSRNQLPSLNKEKSIPPQTQRNTSKLSNYGQNLMKSGYPQVDQKQVFDKQQHAFNIIDYRPTEYRARLKMFPKLTLEDRINQRYGSPLKQNN